MQCSPGLYHKRVWKPTRVVGEILRLAGHLNQINLYLFSKFDFRFILHKMGFTFELRYQQIMFKHTAHISDNIMKWDIHWLKFTHLGIHPQIPLIGRVHVRICATMQFPWTQLPNTHDLRISLVQEKNIPYTELPYSISRIEIIATKICWAIPFEHIFKLIMWKSETDIVNTISKVRCFIDWWRYVQLISPVLVAYRFL